MTTLRLHGSLDFDSIGDVESELSDALAATIGCSTLVLDLRDLTFASIEAARAIRRFLSSAGGRGVDARVVYPVRHAVKRVFSLVGVGDPDAPADPPTTGSPGRHVVDVQTVDGARDLLGSVFGRLRIQARDNRGGMRLSTASVGPVRLDQIQLRMAFHAETAPMGTYAFGLLKSGSIRRTSQYGEREHVPGDVFLTARPDEAFTSDVDSAVVDVAVFGPELIAEVTQSDEPITFTGYGAVSARAAGVWKRTYGFILSSVLANPEAAGQSLVAAQSARLLAATALETFPNTAIAEPTAADRHDAHPRTIARAVSFIESNADRDIAITDIARDAAVTTRAMQLAFRRHLDTTPAEYLRRVRLHRAHDELLSADARTTTVATIASRWGYLNASHFARRYRSEFDESPSQTLER